MTNKTLNQQGVGEEGEKNHTSQPPFIYRGSYLGHIELQQNKPCVLDGIQDHDLR